jgi:hypothetical protein
MGSFQVEYASPAGKSRSSHHPKTSLRRNGLKASLRDAAGLAQSDDEEAATVGAAREDPSKRTARQRIDEIPS